MRRKAVNSVVSDDDFFARGVHACRLASVEEDPTFPADDLLLRNGGACNTVRGALVDESFRVIRTGNPDVSLLSPKRAPTVPHDPTCVHRGLPGVKKKEPKAQVCESTRRCQTMWAQAQASFIMTMRA